jgi:plastocyanin
MSSSRRSAVSGRLIAALVVALPAVPGALMVGQAAHVFAGSRAASPVQSTMAGMNMAPAVSAAGQRPVLMLHRKVIHVTISNFKFSPSPVVVSPGTRVIWTNRDSDPHTIDSVKNLWASEALDTNGKFARVFKASGTFAYYCGIHPFMHGTVIVRK